MDERREAASKIVRALVSVASPELLRKIMGAPPEVQEELARSVVAYFEEHLPSRRRQRRRDA